MTDLSWLDAIEERLAAATEGPWAIWRDLDYQGFLTVGQASGVIPEGETFVDGEHNPTAHVYTEDDAALIANAPADIARLVKALRDAHAERDALSAANDRVKIRAAHGLRMGYLMHPAHVLAALTGEDS